MSDTKAKFVCIVIFDCYGFVSVDFCDLRYKITTKNLFFALQVEKNMVLKDETIAQVSQELATYRLKLSSVQKEHNLKSTQLDELKSDIEQALEKLKDNSIMEPAATASECTSSTTDHSEDSTENNLADTEPSAAEPSTMDSEIHIQVKVVESKNNTSRIVNPESLEKKLLTSEQVVNRSDINTNMESEIIESNLNVTDKLKYALHDTSLSTNMESENNEASPNVPNQLTEPSNDATHNTNFESESSLNVPNRSSEATQDGSLCNSTESGNAKSGQDVPNEPKDVNHDTSFSTCIESANNESSLNVLDEPSDDAYLSTRIEPENAEPNENAANQPTESSNVLSLSSTESPVVELSEMIITEEEEENEMRSSETDSKTNEDEQITQSENEISDISDDEMEPTSTWDRNAQDQLDHELGLPEFQPIGQTDVELKAETPFGPEESDATTETKVNGLEDLNEEELGNDVPENEGQNLPWMLD